MKKIFLFILTIIIFCSCENDDEPKYYNSKFYPVIKGEFVWKKNEIFENIPISIRLESRIDYDDSKRQGVFEPINLENSILISSRDIYILSDTIKKGSNLLNYSFAEIETYMTELNRKEIPDSYILWLNKSGNSDFYINKGYYTLNFSTLTENNFKIKDSIVIQLK